MPPREAAPAWPAFAPRPGGFVAAPYRRGHRHVSLRRPSPGVLPCCCSPCPCWPPPSRPPAPPAAPSPVDDLREQIRQADSQLFAVAFEACDADKAAAMTTEDMEFFHDKDGKSASNREDFRRSVANLCDNARKDGWRLRRDLGDSSLQVFPLHDERGLEMGDHRSHGRG